MRPPSGVKITQCPGSNTPCGTPGAGTQRSGTHTESTRGAWRTGGVGDLSLETKVAVWQSLDWLSQIAVGVEGHFPTGSERRGLGGEAAVEPFVTGGIALGDFDLLASVAYEFNLNANVAGPNEQELTASAAVGWRVARVFAPLVELVTVTRTRAAPDDELRGKTRVSIIPGFNAKLLPGSTLRFGVEFPLTRARTADYTLLGGFVKEF